MYIPTSLFGSGNYIPCSGLLAWYNFPIQGSGSALDYTTFTGNDAANSKTSFQFRHIYENLLQTGSDFKFPGTDQLIAPSLQLYVLDDVNPILSVSGSDPAAPYIVSQSNEVIGVKSWYLASSSYDSTSLQPFVVGTSSTPRIMLPFFSQSVAFEAFPTDTNQLKDTTIVMTGKMNYNTTTEGDTFRFLENQVDIGVGEGPLDDRGYFGYDQCSIFSKTSSLQETTFIANATNLPSWSTAVTQSINNNTDGIETFVWQVDSNGSTTSNNQTILSLRSSALNNFRDVYYYQRPMGGGSGYDANDFKSMVGYNRTSVFSTAGNAPFEYQVAHQHYWKKLTPTEINKVHLANISQTTILAGCDEYTPIQFYCDSYSFNAGGSGGTATYTLCGELTASTEVLAADQDVIRCIDPLAARGLTGPDSQMIYITHCNQ